MFSMSKKRIEKRITRVSNQPSNNQIVVENDEKILFLSLFFSSQFLMLSIKDWTSLVQVLVDSGCTISAEVKVRTHEQYFYTFLFVYYLNFEVNSSQYFFEFNLGIFI